MAFKFFSSAGAHKTTATMTAPAGALMDFAGASAPAGWLICDGQEYDQSVYSNLYAVVGATYNTGGETPGFFRVPDFRGRASVAPDGGAGRVTSNNTLAASSGVQSVALTTTETPAHTHAAGTLAGPSHSHSAAGGTLKVGVHTHGNNFSLPSHSHGAGSYTMPNHSHGGAGLSVNIGADNLFSATQSGTGVNRANATHTHSAAVTGNTGNLVAAPVTGTSDPASPAISGSVSNSAGTENVTGTTDASGTAAVTGSTGSALTQVAPGAGHTNLQPYLVVNKIIKY